MAKQDIKKLLDDANKLLESECENQVDIIKSELKSYKTKTLNKIQKTIP
ncbi:MAG: hypothetical protein ACT4OD_00290 [Candidatus Nitrosotenuis sp.]